MEVDKMDWFELLEKGISISKTVLTKLTDYAMEQQGIAQRKLDDTSSRVKRLSDKELERRVKKAYKEDGKRDLETLVMAQEYSRFHEAPFSEFYILSVKDLYSLKSKADSG